MLEDNLLDLIKSEHHQTLTNDNVTNARRFGRMLYHRRKSMGITQKEMAKLVGVCLTTYFTIERGVHAGVKVLVAILDELALGIHRDDDE